MREPPRVFASSLAILAISGVLRECVSLQGTQRPHLECGWGHLPAIIVGTSVTVQPDLDSVFPLEGVDEEVAREPIAHLFRDHLRE